MNIGLKDLYFAPLQSESAESTTYGAPFKLAAAIEAGITANKADASVYADDALYDSISLLNSFEVTLTVADLEAGSANKVLGRSENYVGQLDTESDIPVEGALMFRSLRSDGTYDYVVLYKGKFSVNDANYATKGDSIEYQNVELVGTFGARLDGKMRYVVNSGEAKAATAIAGWFTTVQEPVEDTQSGKTNENNGE